MRDGDPARGPSGRAGDSRSYSVGARLPRTALGRRTVGRVRSAGRRGLELGRSRAQRDAVAAGLAPLDHVHGGISRELALVATFPQLEYPRPGGAGARDARGGAAAVGAAVRRRRAARRRSVVAAGAGGAVDRAGPRGRMLRAALAGLAELPVRVLASTNKRGETHSFDVPANARLVDWVSYSRTMPHCDVVVCHAGHGTLMRALTSGCTVVACPAAGDMNENAARVAWAGAGVRLPAAFISARGLTPRGPARPRRRPPARMLTRAGGLGGGTRSGGSGGGAGGGPRPRHELVFVSWIGTGWHGSWRQGHRTRRSRASSGARRRRCRTGRASMGWRHRTLHDTLGAAGSNARSW